MSSISVNTITDASGGATTTINGFTPSVSNMAGRNRIINGDMRIDQRNAGAAVSPMSGAYAIDRWVGSYLGSGVGRFSAQQSSTAPSGFSKSWLITVTTSDGAPSASYGYMVEQWIEGYNIADLGFGSASASPITVSFWVRSSVTGTFPLIIYNGAGTRTYGATYTITSANTFEYKTVTITGDTTGTWASDNTAGLALIFGFGGGSSRTLSTGWQAASGATPTNVTGCTSLIATSGATFYITGVQLEEGSVATPFEHRQYGQELALCQRYYYRTKRTGSATTCIGNAHVYNSTAVYSVYPFKQTMRAAPTGNRSSASDFSILSAGVNYVPSTVILQSANEDQVEIALLGLTGAPTGNGAWLRFQTDDAWMDFSAEL